MTILFIFTKLILMFKTDPPEQKKNFKDCFIIYAEEETEIHYMLENQLQVVHGRKKFFRNDEDSISRLLEN